MLYLSRDTLPIGLEAIWVYLKSVILLLVEDKEHTIPSDLQQGKMTRNKIQSFLAIVCWTTSFSS